MTKWIIRFALSVCIAFFLAAPSFAITHSAISDHNGNIHRVLNATTKAIVADYAYSPFGALIGEWGTAPEVCPFRFKSKYYDRETELLYFGLRYFHAASAKWISRDPLGERGAVNLTAFCDNDPLNRVDTLGGNSLGWGEGLAESSVAQSGDPKDLLQFVTTPMPDEERAPIILAIPMTDQQWQEEHAQKEWWQGLSLREKFLQYVPAGYPLSQASKKFVYGEPAGEVGKELISAGLEVGMFALMGRMAPVGPKGGAAGFGVTRAAGLRGAAKGFLTTGPEEFSVLGKLRGPDAGVANSVLRRLSFGSSEMDALQMARWTRYLQRKGVTVQRGGFKSWLKRTWEGAEGIYDPRTSTIYLAKRPTRSAFWEEAHHALTHKTGLVQRHWERLAKTWLIQRRHRLGIPNIETRGTIEQLRQVRVGRY
jgi:RHS repeat-associated protein